MSGRRRQQRNGLSSAALLEPVADLEQLVLLGGLGYVVYLIMTGQVKNFFCPGGGGFCSLLPKQTTMNQPLPPFGAGITHATAPSIPQGDLVVMTSTGPVTYGPNGVVPGTGQTVNDLRSIGYSDSDIASMIANPITDGGPVSAGPAGGAGGSW